MSQLIEIEGRYYQEAEIVMLATKQYHSDIELDETLQLSKHKGYCNKNGQNLYIVFNEELKVGDWYIKDGLIKLYQGSLPEYHYSNAKKIIATTNESLIINSYPINDIRAVDSYTNLPQPSDSFIKKYIEEYNKGNVITNVLVEYEIGKSYSGNSGLEVKQWLKVDSNNTITIKKVEPELYTREEVKILLQKSLLFAFKEGNNHIGSNLPFLRTTMDNWIKQNL